MHCPTPTENAITLWAEVSTRAETRDREERLRDKKHVIRSFLNYLGKHPGEVGPVDVRAWRKHLESIVNSFAHLVALTTRRAAQLSRYTENPRADQEAVRLWSKPWP